MVVVYLEYLNVFYSILVKLHIFGIYEYILDLHESSTPIVSYLLSTYV